MKGLRGLAAGILLCAGSASSAWAAEAGAPPSDPCPGATAWARAHPDTSGAAMAQRDMARSFTDPTLRAELARRFARDQQARIKMLAKPADARARHTVAVVDEDNANWLYELVRDKGFPTAAQVGEQGVSHAWLLLHHADRAPQFQAALLPTLAQRARDGEFSRNDFARLTDRVLKGQGKPQHYGTQFSPEGWAAPHFGLPDEQSVREIEANRRELGVMPLADYVCMMREARKARPD